MISFLKRKVSDTKIHLLYDFNLKKLQERYPDIEVVIPGDSTWVALAYSAETKTFWKISQYEYLPFSEKIIKAKGLRWSVTFNQLIDTFLEERGIT